MFAGKQGFMTLRDLFRWAERYSCTDTQISGKFYDWDQHLADHGEIFDQYILSNLGHFMFMHCKVHTIIMKLLH